MRHKNLALFFTLAAFCFTGVCFAKDDLPKFKVWGDQKPPGKNEPTEKVGKMILEPLVTVYLPSKEKANGTAVLVCPGGGYQGHAISHEGIEVAKWLNEEGVAAFLLQYRIPRRANQPKHLAPLQDAQRALSIVRSKAKEYGIEENKIGILGFSAGGHLTLMTSTCYNARAYEPRDEIDKVSCRPDFAIPVYPAYIVDKQNKLVDEIKITKDTPPMFFAHAGDDPYSAAGSALIYAKLRQFKSPSEIHVWAKGGHGFGMRKRNEPSDQWTRLAAEWMRRIGLVKK